MEKIAIFEALAPLIAVGVVAISLGWVTTTWLRVKNGYPLDGAWGQAIYPKTDGEAKERLRLLSQENAQLKAEMGAVRERLETVERIETDSGYRLTHEIERLRDAKEKVQ